MSSTKALAALAQRPPQTLARSALAGALAAVLGLAGCATKPPKDYSAFKAANPQTILVLPPKNSSPDVNATPTVYTFATRPIAESGFYVLPVALVDEQFKANGLSVADDTHQVDWRKLREIFGADAALYIDIKDYGTKFMLINSATVVTAEGRLVDLRSGQELWSGRATANSEEQRQQIGNAGLAGLLVAALVKQVVASTVDQSRVVAMTMSQRLLSAGSPNALLYGPHHPSYPQQPASK